jgi:uncharacterized hydrophobic protein (TIGR00271 family)
LRAVKSKEKVIEKDNAMIRPSLKFIRFIREWFREYTAGINHNAVRAGVFAEGEISAGYFFVLNVANLIALCGLLMNSSPVIIGAMLISPLMGPILSFGFAFVTGDKVIWRNSIRKIILSVGVTIVLAAVATYLSPLKEATGEILSRTKPNLFDLIIAFLAGIAGASALCTKKNYLTIVPGVAIATAVIPPLSVAGFGAGTANLAVFYGGFLLFFTNFVAIIIATCIVFYFYGFDMHIIDETDQAKMRKRFAYLLTVLAVISIPLAYTLHTSIAEVRLRTAIRNALTHELNREKESRLATFTFKAIKDGGLEINALVNTVNYLNDVEISKVESQIEAALRRKTRLNVDQIKVQAGGLKEQIPVIPLKATAPPRSPGDMVRSAEESVRAVARHAGERIDRIIAPSKIAGFSMTFSDKSERVPINLTVRRDAPFSSEESLWLSRMLASELGRPVDLTVGTVPFLPLLLFKPGETGLSEEIKKTVLNIKEIYSQDGNITVSVEAFPEKSGRAGLTVARKRSESVTGFLISECRIPGDRIKTVVSSRRVRQPSIRITVVNSRRPLQ